MTTGSYTQVLTDRAPTLQHRDWKDPPIVTEEETPPPDVQYVVRRLTPTECAVLQGFPRWYCSEIAIENPTEEQIAFWTNVWQTYADVTGEKKPKSRKQVIAWLAKPYQDSAGVPYLGEWHRVTMRCVRAGRHHRTGRKRKGYGLTIRTSSSCCPIAFSSVA